MSQNYLIRIDEPERPFTELAEVPRQKERQLQLVEEPMFFLPSFRGILRCNFGANTIFYPVKAYTISLPGILLSDFLL